MPYGTSFESPALSLTPLRQVLSTPSDNANKQPPYHPHQALCRPQLAVNAECLASRPSNFIFSVIMFPASRHLEQPTTTTVLLCIGPQFYSSCGQLITVRERTATTGLSSTPSQGATTRKQRNNSARWTILIFTSVTLQITFGGLVFPFPEIFP